MYKIICTGTFKPTQTLLGPRFIGIDLTYMLAILAYLGFLIPLKLSRLKDKTMKKTKNLTDHCANCFALILISFGGIANAIMNK